MGVILIRMFNELVLDIQGYMLWRQVFFNAVDELLTERSADADYMFAALEQFKTEICAPRNCIKIRNSKELRIKTEESSTVKELLGKLRGVE